MCVANIPIKFIQIDTNYKSCTIVLRIYIYQLPKIISDFLSYNNYHEIDFNSRFLFFNSNKNVK